MTAPFTLLLLAQAHGEAVGPQSPFEVNFGLFIWTWVVFGLLLVVLRKYAWPSIIGATLERERTIRHQLEEAEKMNLDARTALAESQRLRAEAQVSAQSLLAEAKTAAEKERAVILDKAKQEQESLVDRARREIATERERAASSLRREAVDLSLAAAAKLIGQRLDTDADRKLVSAYLESAEVGR